MARLVSNPPNPWAGPHVEWLGEPPPAGFQVFEEDAKSALTRNDSPDVPFTWSLNPYRGCQHGCAYCYARPTHTHLGFGAGTDFDTRIVVKRNLPEVFRRELARGKAKGTWIALSGVTDPYQPIESHYKITRQCLEAAREFRRPIGIVTRGSLVRRDAELLAEMARIAPVRVHISIPFVDPDVSRAIEPAAPAPAARFETLRILSEAGVPTGVAVAPVIPGLNDDQIPEILQRARDAGAERTFTILLRLPGEAREVFEQRLRANLPLRADKVMHALDDARRAQGTTRIEFGERMRGRGPRWDLIQDTFTLHARRLGFERTDEELDVLAPDTPKSQQGELFD